MNTNPVANTASSAPSSSAGRAASRQPESAGNPFQQMLSDEIAGKKQSGNMPVERPAETAPNKTATNKQAAIASNGTDKAAREEDRAEKTAAILSPELAAMVASLLQRQNGTGDEPQVSSDTEQADPLAFLGRPNGRQKGDGQAGQMDLNEVANPKLDAAERPVPSAAQPNKQPDLELDLRSASSKQVSIESSSGKDKQPAEFSSMLQQLGQAAQAGPARNANPATSAHIAPRVGSQGWDQALGQRMVWMVSGAEQSASLTLNPPELGPLQVVLNVSNSQASATFVAPQAEVRQALEAAMPKLREMLGEAGIQLDQASVNQDMPQQQGEFARSGRDGSRSSSYAGNEQNADEPAVTQRVSAAGNGLVDTFA